MQFTTISASVRAMSVAIGVFFLLLAPATAATRLKDLASIEGVRDNQLLGYGLVVGLAGTGDKQQTVFTTQSLANILQRIAGAHARRRPGAHQPSPPARSRRG